jgi:hypothetical protein
MFLAPHERCDQGDVLSPNLPARDPLPWSRRSAAGPRLRQPPSQLLSVRSQLLSLRSQLPSGPRQLPSWLQQLPPYPGNIMWNSSQRKVNLQLDIGHYQDLDTKQDKDQSGAQCLLP